MRMTQVGYISDITTSSGMSQSGNEWKKTRFKFSVLEYTKRDGSSVVRKYWVNTFNQVMVKNGPAMVLFDVINRKTGRKNDNGQDVYELALDVVSSLSLDVVSSQSLDMTNSMNEVANEAFEENEDIPF